MSMQLPIMEFCFSFYFIFLSRFVFSLFFYVTFTLNRGHYCQRKKKKKRRYDEVVKSGSKKSLICDTFVKRQAVQNVRNGVLQRGQKFQIIPLSYCI